jgi:hypothetical protein
VHAFGQEVEKGRSPSEDSPGKSMRPYLKRWTESKRIKVVECLLSRLEALSSIPNTVKRKVK